MARFTFYNPKSGTMRSGYWGRFTVRWSRLVGEALPIHQIATVDPTLVGPGDAVTAVGGDGTLRAVAQHFGVGRKPCEEIPTILLLPAGSSNSVAKSLGIPIAGVSWPYYLRYHRRVSLDVGMAGGTLFLLCLSAGVSGQAVTLAERKRQKGTSSWSYTRAVARCLLKDYRLRVEAEGIVRPQEVAEVILANMTRFGGALHIADADPSDGFLSLAVMRKPRRFAVRGLLSAFHGPAVPTVPVRQARVEGDGVFQIDGEPGGELPVTAEAIPRALPMGLPG